MTSNFALSLSFDGIRLLQRVTGGWHLVGDVDVTDANLPEALAHLRATALELDPSGLRTKLLIPNDQIKYTAIDSTRTEIADIHAALDGATPYAIDDLVIDFDRSGGRTHIAAVARETLQEAEAFATEHQFNPICFAAIAEPFTFSTEVFFGRTTAADALIGSDAEVSRDDAAVLIIGTAAGAQDEMPAPVETPVPVVEAEAIPDVEDDTVEKAVFTSRKNKEDDDASIPDDPAPEPLFARRQEPALSATAADDFPAAPHVAAPITATDNQKPIAFNSPPVASHQDRPQRAAAAEAMSEKAGMTVFGARKTEPVRGKPRFLGLILTGVLLLGFVLAALWANTLPEAGFSQWFKRGSDLQEVETVAIPEIVEAPVVAVAPEVPEAPEAVIIDEPAAALPIVRSNVGHVLSPAEADRIYAATGVYQRAPQLPLALKETTLETFIQARELPALEEFSVAVLPDPDFMTPDVPLGTQRVPPPAGTRYQRDLRGFVLARPEGIMTPNGAFVIAGRPDIVPAYRPGTAIPDTPVVRQAPVNENGDPLILIAGLPSIVPPNRPEGLVPPAPAPVIASAPAQSTQTAPVAVETLDVALAPVNDTTTTQATAEATAPQPQELATLLDLPVIDTAPSVPLAAAQPPQDIAVLEDIIAVAPSDDEVVQVPLVQTPSIDDTVITVAPTPQDVDTAVLIDPPLIDTSPSVPTSSAAIPEGLIVIEGSPSILPRDRPSAIVALAAAVTQAIEGPTVAVPTAEDTLVVTAPSDALPTPQEPRVPQGSESVAVTELPLIDTAPSLPTPAAVVPEVVRLFEGRPSRIPPNRPATIVAIAPALVAPDVPTADIPEGLIVISGRPSRVPPNRPEIAIAVAPVLPVPETPNAVVTEGLIVINGSPSRIPPNRPATILAMAPAAPAIEVPDLPAEAVPSIDPQPEGLIVIAGRPSRIPPNRPATIRARAAVVAEPEVATLALIRPAVRPSTLVITPPAPEFAADPALAGSRPNLRPEGLAPVAVVEAPVEEPAASAIDINTVIAALADAAPASPFVNTTAQAVAVSVRPDSRPRNFARVVDRARAAAPRATAPTTTVRSVAVQPTGPVSGGVARAATLENAISLRKINLIGVYGRPSDRRALVRLGNGRYVKVEIGSALDGGRVTAINDSALNYTKSGRTYALEMPSG